MLGIRMASSRCGNSFVSIIKTDHHDAFKLKLSFSQENQRNLKTTLRTNRFYATEARFNDTNLGLERIYYGSLAQCIRAVKTFSLTTTCIGLVTQPILMDHSMKMGNTGISILVFGLSGFFILAKPLLLHFFTEKYVTEMKYNPATGEYIAMTISFFGKRIETKFRPRDVHVPEVREMFTSFFIGEKPMFVDPTLFKNSEHYERIMGYKQ